MATRPYLEAGGGGWLANRILVKQLFSTTEGSYIVVDSKPYLSQSTRLATKYICIPFFPHTEYTFVLFKENYLKLFAATWI